MRLCETELPAPKCRPIDKNRGAAHTLGRQAPRASVSIMPKHAALDLPHLRKPTIRNGQCVVLRPRRLPAVEVPQEDLQQHRAHKARRPASTLAGLLGIASAR